MGELTNHQREQLAEITRRHQVLPDRGGSADIALLLAEVERMSRELATANERLGSCCCDRNPATTQGPEEDCPHHGRRYSDWVERGDVLAQRLATASAKLDRIARLAEPYLDQPAGYQHYAINLTDGVHFAVLVDDLRAALAFEPRTDE